MGFLELSLGVGKHAWKMGTLWDCSSFPQQAGQWGDGDLKGSITHSSSSLMLYIRLQLWIIQGRPSLASYIHGFHFIHVQIHTEQYIPAKAISVIHCHGTEGIQQWQIVIYSVTIHHGYTGGRTCCSLLTRNEWL